MKNKLVLFGLLVLFVACSDDKGNPTEPEDNVTSMYSLLNIDDTKTWNYQKEKKFRNDPWELQEPEYASYEVSSDTSSVYTTYLKSDNSKTFSMDLSYDSTQAYMNTFSVGDDFIDPVLNQIDFDRIKIADLERNQWTVDTVFYEDIDVDEKNTFYGYIAFEAKRVADTTVTYNGEEKVAKRFQLEAWVEANQVQNGYVLRVYPGYYFSLIDGVGFYNIRLENHTNTAIKVEGFNYTLESIE